MAVRPPSPLDFVTPADLVRFGDKLLAQIKVLIEQTRPAALLRLPEVMRRTGYGRSSIYQKSRRGHFLRLAIWAAGTARLGEATRSSNGSTAALGAAPRSAAKSAANSAHIEPRRKGPSWNGPFAYGIKSHLMPEEQSQ